MLVLLHARLQMSCALKLARKIKMTNLEKMMRKIIPAIVLGALTLCAVKNARATSIMRPGQWTVSTETTVYNKDKTVLVPKISSTLEACYTAVYLQKADFISEFGMTAPDNGRVLNAQECQYWSVAFSKTAPSATHQLKMYCEKTPRGAMWNVITATATDKKLDLEMEGRIEENTEAFSQTRIRYVHKQDSCDKSAIKFSDKEARRSTAKLMPQPRVALLGEDYFLGDLQGDSGVVVNRYFRLRESKKDFLRDFSVSHIPDEDKPSGWLATAEFFYKDKLAPDSLIAKSKDDAWAITRHIYQNAEGPTGPFQVEVVYAHRSPQHKGIVLYRADYEYPASERANMLKPDGLVAKTTAALANALQKLPPIDVFNQAGRRTFTHVADVGFSFDGRRFYLHASRGEDEVFSNHYSTHTQNGLAQKESVWINHYTMPATELARALREQMSPKLSKGAAFEVLRTSATGEPAVVFYVLESDVGGIEVNLARPMDDSDGNKIVRHAQTIKGTYAEHKAAIDARKMAWADALMVREWRTVTVEHKTKTGGSK